MNLFQEAKQVLDKDGKVNALGPYGKQKLTGREISAYFRQNPVKDQKLKNAVSVALDLSGAMSIAQKEIKKFYGDKILKSKEVQSALRVANESVIENGQIINENYRTLAQKGMGTESEKDARVGLELDFYDSQGNKQFGKIVKKDRKGYTVKDSKGKTHTFVFLDRQKAKKLLTKTDKLSNIIKKNTIQKGKFAGYMTDEVEEGTMSIGIFDSNPSEKKKAIAGMQKLLKGKQNVKVGSPEGRKIGDQLDMKYLSDDELADDFAKPSNKNMTISQLLKKHEKRLGLNFKEEVEEAVSPAQQAAIAISKKEKGEKPKNVMDAYRQMWEDGQKYAPQLDEEVANITVDPNNKIPTPAGQNKHSLEIVKQARRFGIKASQLGKHIRIKGNKKAVNDFLRMVIGRSSYGDPTEKDMSTPQIDKMLTKGLK